MFNVLTIQTQSTRSIRLSYFVHDNYGNDVEECMVLDKGHRETESYKNLIPLYYHGFLIKGSSLGVSNSTSSTIVRVEGVGSHLVTSYKVLQRSPWTWK